MEDLKVYVPLQGDRISSLHIDYPNGFSKTYENLLASQIDSRAIYFNYLTPQEDKDDLYLAVDNYFRKTEGVNKNYVLTIDGKKFFLGFPDAEPVEKITLQDYQYLES